MLDKNENEGRELDWTPEERSWFKWVDAKIVTLQSESFSNAAAQGYAKRELNDLLEQRREREMHVRRPEPPSHWATFVRDGTAVIRVDEGPDGPLLAVFEEVRRPKSFDIPDHWERFNGDEEGQAESDDER